MKTAASNATIYKYHPIPTYPCSSFISPAKEKDMQTNTNVHTYEPIYSLGQIIKYTHYEETADQC